MASFSSSYEYFNFTPIQWPAADPYLPALLADPSLEDFLTPTFVDATRSPNNNNAAMATKTPKQVWQVGLSYTRALAKCLVRGFCRSGSAVADYAGLESACGLVYFSKWATGPPGLVHGGCASTVAGTIAADFSMMHLCKTICTRTIEVEFIRFIRVDSVVRYDVRKMPVYPGDWETGVRVQVVFSDPANPKHIFLRATGAFALPSPRLANASFVESRRAVRTSSYEQTWSDQASRVAVPSTLDGWWTPAAKEVVRRLEAMKGKQRLSFANMLEDFPQIREKVGGPSYSSVYDDGFEMFDCGMGIDFEDEGVALELLRRFPVKILRRHYWRAPGEPAPEDVRCRCLCGAYLFTSLCMGSQGIAHAGALATACDDIQGQLILRERGFVPASNTTTLRISYHTPTPLNVPVIAVARMRKMLHPQISETEAVLLPADVFFGLDSPLEDCFLRDRVEVLVRTTALWKRPKPEKMGMEQYLDYDELRLMSNKLDQSPPGEHQWSKL